MILLKVQNTDRGTSIYTNKMDEEKDEFYNHLQECRTLFRTATEKI